MLPLFIWGIDNLRRCRFDACIDANKKFQHQKRRRKKNRRRVSGRGISYWMSACLIFNMLYKLKEYFELNIDKEHFEMGPLQFPKKIKWMTHIDNIRPIVIFYLNKFNRLWTRDLNPTKILTYLCWQSWNFLPRFLWWNCAFSCRNNGQVTQVFSRNMSPYYFSKQFLEF